MKILLIGGTGWLGHNIALLLKGMGADVTLLNRGRKSTYLDRLGEGIPAVIADKNDEEAMKSVLAAGYTHVIDTVPTEKTINCVRKYATRLHHYIHCSSTGGYAPLPFVPCNETAHYGGFGSTTGWSQKMVVDNLAMECFAKEGFPATVIRPCYITGEGMLPLDNLGDRREDFIKDILDEKVLDLPNDGQALLQPIHVKDLARSFILALSHPESKGQIFNICLDHAFTLSRYLEINAAALGKKAHVNLMPLDEMLVKYAGKTNEIGLRFMACHMCFSIDKARRMLGYAPSYTPEEAVEETAIWTARIQGLI